ncbi:hypothetical protein CPB85DRAFT_1258221 [Mucidula mucida]|nr:hypothetical protein CPB85DRAFT_1258221 [Mucidula mucida]
MQLEEQFDDTTMHFKADKLRYQRENHTLKAKIKCIPNCLATVMHRVTRLFRKKENKQHSYYLKVDGIIPDDAHNVFNELVAPEGVTANKVVRVFKRIGAAFGATVEENVLRHSVSSNDTSHKNETYKTKFATVIDKNNQKLQFFLNLKMAVNHTTGGPTAWAALFQEEQLKKYKAMRMQIIRNIGQKEFDKLTTKKKEDVNFFLWAKCCMHKEMNVFKGSCYQIKQFWPENNLSGPQKMFTS